MKKISAIRILNEVFEPSDASWRGVGVIPESGLAIRDTYKDFDALKNFVLKIPKAKKETGCICGDILRGAKSPTDCKLFGKACTPADPRGACMVSSEGACAAWFKYNI